MDLDPAFAEHLRNAGVRPDELTPSEKVDTYTRFKASQKSTQGASTIVTIRIPEERNWDRQECYNLPHYEFECAHELLVDMEATLQAGMAIVASHINNTFRVPPLVITRLYRGGKTTVLKEMFIQLKANNYFPIIVSLNGPFEYRHKEETNLEALIRLIAVQLIRVAPTESIKSFVCAEQDLLARMDQLSQSQNKPIVLIIDELNRFDVPVDVNVANFLKVNFLDKVGRYLIFSSHVVVRFVERAICERASQAYMSPTTASVSVRGICNVHLPFCSDKEILRQMGDVYSGLTDLEVTLGGGIPSLIYATKQHFELAMETRFNSVMESIITNKSKYLAVEGQSLMQSFLSEVMDGVKCQTLFSCFADIFVNKKDFVRYPLPYVACIWGWLSNDDGLHRLVDSLSNYAKDVGGGKDWEVIIVTALFLRFLHCQYVPTHSNHGPFDIASDGVDDVRTLDIPGEVRTIEDALDYLRSHLRAKPLVPKTILIALPSYMKFPDIDGLIIYQSSSEQAFKVYAYQAKTRRGYPRHNVPEQIVQCFLLRGNAPQHQFRKGKWYYVDEATMRDLIGYSLKPFYPREWGNVQEISDDGFD